MMMMIQAMIMTKNDEDVSNDDEGDSNDVDKGDKCSTNVDTCGRVENIVGKGENVVYLHFLLFSPCFQKHSSSGCGIVC